MSIRNKEVGRVRYQDKTIGVLQNNHEYTLHTAGTIAATDISVIANPLDSVPIDISDATEMGSLLIAANEGCLFKFTGTTTATYTKNNIYVVRPDNNE